MSLSAGVDELLIDLSSSSSPARGGPTQSPHPMTAGSSSRGAPADGGGGGLPSDLVARVIRRKMREQREHGLPGLPYDLWLAVGDDHGQLFQTLKDQGQLASVVQS